MTLPDRSVTLRILVELLLAPGQALSTARSARRYGVRTMIVSRLEQLSAGRFLAIGPDGRIALTRKGLGSGGSSPPAASCSGSRARIECDNSGEDA